MDEKRKQVRRVLMITLILNLIVAASKIAIGVVTGALAITADGLHSVIDSSGNVVGLVATHLANRPPDDDHPYGHSRFETLAALIIGALLLLTAWEVGRGAIDRLTTGEAPTLTPLAFGVMIGTLAVNVVVSRYQVRQGKRLDSQILLADAANTGADVFVSVSVLVSMALVTLFGWAWADVVAALIVMVLIARAGLKILRQTGQVLVDTAPYTPEQLADVVRQVPSAGEIARVRSRGTVDDAYIDVDMQVNPAMTADQTAAIADAVRAHLSEQLAGVSEVEVHFVPEAGREPDYALLARAHADALAMTTHEVNVNERPDGKVLEMHVEVSPSLTLDAAHEQVTQLEEKIRQDAPEVAEVITHIEPASPDQQDDTQPDRNRMLESRVCELLNERYPGLDWHDVRVYSDQNGFAATMHVAMPPRITVEAAHRLAEEAEATLRTRINDLDRVTIHTEPPEDTYA